MTHARLAILMLGLWLSLAVTAGSALGASGRLMPTAPGLLPAASPSAPPPEAAAVAPQTHRPAMLPRTGFPVEVELVLAGALGLLGAGLRTRWRPAGLVHLEPVPSGSR